jgi:hypothetical protein
MGVGNSIQIREGTTNRLIALFNRLKKDFLLTSDNKFNSLEIHTKMGGER